MPSDIQESVGCAVLFLFGLAALIFYITFKHTDLINAFVDNGFFWGIVAGIGCIVFACMMAAAVSSRKIQCINCGWYGDRAVFGRCPNCGRKRFVAR